MEDLISPIGLTPDYNLIFLSHFLITIVFHSNDPSQIMRISLLQPQAHLCSE